MTLLDSQRWAESSKGAEPVSPVNLWDFPSLQSTTVTSETLPSLSTSIEVRTYWFWSQSEPSHSRPAARIYFLFLMKINGDGDVLLVVKIEEGKNRSGSLKLL